MTKITGSSSLKAATFSYLNHQVTRFREEIIFNALKSIAIRFRAISTNGICQIQNLKTYNLKFYQLSEKVSRLEI